MAKKQEAGTAPTQEAAKVVSVRGMVRDMVCEYSTASKSSEPAAWTAGDDKPSGRRVAVTADDAQQVAQYIMDAREWARLAGSFKDATRRSNVLRDALGIARQFANVAGVAVEQPERLTLRDNTKHDLPTEPVDDLNPGDEIMVVRHVTRYGLDLVDRFPAVVKGRAANGDYWLTSVSDGTARACRPTEVVVVKRATAGDSTADEKPKKRAKK